MGEAKPLDGITVIELGQLIAGPFAGQMLAWYGADVIKIESPGRGDPLRSWRALDDSGTSYWWYSMGRNKRSVAVDLNQQDGRALIRDLLRRADVVIENFRPGKMESWGLGPDDLKPLNPDLVYTRVSGYGQSGPYASRPGFASACEALGGFRHVNGFADRPPVRPNLSLGDTLAGMHAVIGTMMALFARGRSVCDGAGGDQSALIGGQTVDVSIVESVLNMLESVVPEFTGAGLVREPSGSTLTGIVPTNTYRCADDRYVVIGGNGDSIFRRLMRAAERADLADDARLQDNPGRVVHEAEIDAALSDWTGSRNAAEILGILAEAEVPSAPIYDAADICEDPHFRSRGFFETVETGGGPLEIPALHPKLQQTPGATHSAGPALGQHTCQVLTEMLSLDQAAIDALIDRDIVQQAPG